MLPIMNKNSDQWYGHFSGIYMVFLQYGLYNQKPSFMRHFSHMDAWIFIVYIV